MALEPITSLLDQPRFRIETGHDEQFVWQRIGGDDAVTRILDTADRQARQCLLDMGWLPPSPPSADMLVTITVGIARNGDVHQDTLTHGNEFAEVYRGMHLVRAEIDRLIVERRSCPYNPSAAKRVAEQEQEQADMRLARKLLEGQISCQFGSFKDDMSEVKKGSALRAIVAAIRETRQERSR